MNLSSLKAGGGDGIEKTTIWNIPKGQREALIESAPRIRMSWELSSAAYENEDGRVADSTRKLGFSPSGTGTPFDKMSDLRVDDAAMSVRMAKNCKEEPWNGLDVVSVAFRGTRVFSKTPVAADTSFMGSRRHYASSKPGRRPSYRICSKDAGMRKSP